MMNELKEDIVKAAIRWRKADTVDKLDEQYEAEKQLIELIDELLKSENGTNG